MATETLPLEQELERLGIHITQHGGTTSIHIPPVKHFRDLPRVYRLVWYPFFVVLIAEVIAAIVAVRTGDPTMLAPFAFYLVALGIGSAATIQSMYKYVILEMDAEEIRLLHASHRLAHIVASWRRKSVSDPHINPSNGRLRFNAEGEDPAEISLSISRSANQWIADQFAQALGDESSAPAPQAELAYASPFLANDPTLARWRRRKLAAILSTIIAILGLVVLFTPFSPLALYVLIFAAIPVGIVMGTQKKDFYV